MIKYVVFQNWSLFWQVSVLHFLVQSFNVYYTTNKQSFRNGQKYNKSL